jgi:hypothetical protein
MERVSYVKHWMPMASTRNSLAFVARRMLNVCRGRVMQGYAAARKPSNAVERMTTQRALKKVSNVHLRLRARREREIPVGQDIRTAFLASVFIRIPMTNGSVREPFGISIHTQ